MGLLGRVAQGARMVGRSAGAKVASVGRFTSNFLSSAGQAAQVVANIGHQALKLAEAIPVIKNIPIVQGLVGAGKSALNSVELAGDLARTGGAAGKFLTNKFEKV